MHTVCVRCVRGREEVFAHNLRLSSGLSSVPPEIPRGAILVTRPDRPQTDMVRLYDAHTHVHLTRAKWILTALDYASTRSALSASLILLSTDCVRDCSLHSLEKTSSNRETVVISCARAQTEFYDAHSLLISVVNFIMDSLVWIKEVSSTVRFRKKTLANAFHTLLSEKNPLRI